MFSQWRNVTSLNTFGNTGSWISGINAGLLPNISTGYQRSTTQLLPYTADHISGGRVELVALRPEPIAHRFEDVSVVYDGGTRALDSV
jgi:hypothetical protein